MVTLKSSYLSSYSRACNLPTWIWIQFRLVSFDPSRVFSWCCSDQCCWNWWWPITVPLFQPLILFETKFGNVFKFQTSADFLTKKLNYYPAAGSSMRSLFQRTPNQILQTPCHVIIIIEHLLVRCSWVKRMKPGWNGWNDGKQVSPISQLDESFQRCSFPSTSASCIWFQRVVCFLSKPSLPQIASASQ